MQSFALFAVSAILVSLCAIFLFLGYGVLAGNKSGGGQLPRPAILTVSAIVLIGMFLASLFIGRGFLYRGSDTRIVAAEAAAQGNASQTELTDLADKVDQAAEEVYGGLDTTKEIIGKTDARKEAIEHGRNRAHQKLGSLAERIRAALRGEAPLDELDQVEAEHVTQGVKD